MALLIILPILAFVVLAGGLILALAVGVILAKAMEPPQHGESSDYRLEQGREVSERR